jgi:hypothetical protein
MKKHFIGNTSDLSKELDRLSSKWFVITNVKFINCIESCDFDEIDLFLISYEKEW